MIDVEDLLGRPLSEVPKFDGATLEQIGDRSYLSATENGVSFVVDDNRVIAVHLYAGKKEGFKRFPFRLPLNVSFEMSRERLRAYLGVPEDNRDAGQRTMLGVMQAWDRFISGTIKLRAEYSDGMESVQMFTVMPL